MGNAVVRGSESGDGCGRWGWQKLGLAWGWRVYGGGGWGEGAWGSGGGRGCMGEFGGGCGGVDGGEGRYGWVWRVRVGVRSMGDRFGGVHARGGWGGACERGGGGGGAGVPTHHSGSVRPPIARRPLSAYTPCRPSLAPSSRRSGRSGVAQIT